MKNKLVEIINTSVKDKYDLDAPLFIFSQFIKILHQLYTTGNIRKLPKSKLECFAQFYLEYQWQLSNNPFDSVFGEVLDELNFQEYSLQEHKDAPIRLKNQLIKSVVEDLSSTGTHQSDYCGCGYFLLRSVCSSEKKRMSDKPYVITIQDDWDYVTNSDLLVNIAAIQLLATTPFLETGYELQVKHFVSNYDQPYEPVYVTHSNHIQSNQAFVELNQVAAESPNSAETLKLAIKTLRSVMA
ncbi:hypothetical protein V4T68_002830 [Vibrio parahaemolyticus]